MELICSRNSFFCDDSMIVKVSSTNLFHRSGGCGADLMASTSKLSLYRFATMGLWVTHSNTLQLLKVFSLEAEIGTVEAELQKT